MVPLIKSIRYGMQLWMLTNLLLASIGALFILIAEPYPIPASEWEYALLFASCGLILSLVIVPFAMMLFPKALPFPPSKRLRIIGLGMMSFWVLYSLAVGFVASHIFDVKLAGRVKIFVFTTLLVATPYLFATLLSAALVYRRWLFRPADKPLTISNDAV